MSPRQNWDSPNPSLACECAPPPRTGGGGHICLRVRGWGSSNSDDLRKSLALCILFDGPPPPTKGKAKAISEWSSTCKEPRRDQLPAWGRSPWEASPDRQDGGAPAFPAAGTRSRSSAQTALKFIHAVRISIRHEAQNKKISRENLRWYRMR